jgi:UDP-N-acetylglucosamine 2-epimerase (non-hydrolysing)
MRVLTVFGTRPEVIKLAPVIAALRNRGIETIVCASGQHRGMLDQMLEVFRIQPDFDLDVMQENQSPLDVASRIFEELAGVLDRVRPDWLLVQGDTTTTFAAAWVSYHHRVSIGHVEAGLRTHDKFRPFPEEMNRRLTSALADLHFAPTARAAENLRRENVREESIVVTGNPVVDALESILRRPVEFTDARLAALSGAIVLVTAHRRESFGEPLERVCDAIQELSANHPNLTFVFPVHPNPSVRCTVFARLEANPRILLTEPLAYPEFVHLMKRAEIILSDSGGVQEEAPSVGTPVLVLRDVTERPEAVESGWAEMVGTSRERIIEAAERRLRPGSAESGRATANPFGDGHAGERIAQALIERSAAAALEKATR